MGMGGLWFLVPGVNATRAVIHQISSVRDQRALAMTPHCQNQALHAVAITTVPAVNAGAVVHVVMVTRSADNVRYLVFVAMGMALGLIIIVLQPPPPQPPTLEHTNKVLSFEFGMMPLRQGVDAMLQACRPQWAMVLSGLNASPNCPFSLAAGLARATADTILQSDLSIYHVNKGTEETTDALPRDGDGGAGGKEGIILAVGLRGGEQAGRQAAGEWRAGDSRLGRGGGSSAARGEGMKRKERGEARRGERWRKKGKEKLPPNPTTGVENKTPAPPMERAGRATAVREDSENTLPPFPVSLQSPITTRVIMTSHCISVSERVFVAKSHPHKLESVKLARLVFNKLCDTCCLWLKDFPHRRRQQRFYETSIHAIKNMRRKMEDKHIVIPDFNMLFNLQDQEEQAYFAVFDGHGGVDAAIYAANHLHVNLVRQEMFSQDPGEALCRAFKLTDERFVQKASRENLRCGTTGVVTFLRGSTLHVAWLGDSQVMLVRRGQPVELMKPHKPDREDEKQRIEALGGCVIWFGTWRVNGSLSVSRAIGDSEHKPYICGDADHSNFQLDGTEDYLILACDGFYDTVSPEEAVRVVSDHLQENSGDSTMVAHKLVASARDAGSSDNITVIVVFLRDPRSPPPPEDEDDEEEATAEEGVEEVEEDEEEEEEEEEEASLQGERGGCQDGGASDVGGKGRGSWPLQQCSAPADLGYEDRMDSFTDRTSLSLIGPDLMSEEGRLQLPQSSHPPPATKIFTPEHAPAKGPGAARCPRRGEEGRPAYSHSPQGLKPRVPSCQQRPSLDGYWLEAATLFTRGRGPARRAECPSLKWGPPRTAACHASPAPCPTPATAQKGGQAWPHPGCPTVAVTDVAAPPPSTLPLISCPLNPARENYTSHTPLGLKTQEASQPHTPNSHSI
ncbi:hypothetical protein JZ751_023119 [Albula glossodonta]|uniref:Protein phosphatase 1E n=1 Tax=Albula glossodonta TaxID=121402 RepID=A0A8T2PN13_9TELE|nr:hypothetical protein JZ751_023119 [Albula glossodonta]